MPKELRYPQGSERIPVRVRRAALCLKRKLQRRGAHRVPEDSSSSPSISPHVSTPPTAADYTPALSTFCNITNGSEHALGKQNATHLVYQERHRTATQRQVGAARLA
ncbi:hypothetical protein HETIRDRAFT_441921 [Heterobasidion irregulare TC 32-1]|uniref:Uncharacterized protein n=1 Tax=Heterobasidion irregulare (strain TC 32-1) TaxID=747525 RepID=W4JXM8_HETIT|nr:uncharacterized protein HETIRDRAFT_441921 [Heterobasidion irregulare TC 32-1]ETW77651.1 hypothetical protein HETIRDRAFT_441921 [Heterobasidion irregulare TC 32-1]